MLLSNWVVIFVATIYNSTFSACLLAAHVNVSVIVTVDDQPWTTSTLLLFSCRSIEQ